MTFPIELSDPILNWLIAPGDPGVRYLALRDLLKLPADDPELLAARAEAHTRGPIAHILDQRDKARERCSPWLCCSKGASRVVCWVTRPRLY